MALESNEGKTPTQALQIEAHKVMDQAKRRIDAAEQKLRGSKNAAERIEAQRYIKEAHAELKAAEEKYGWVFDWQKVSAAAADAAKSVEAAAAKAADAAKSELDAKARDASAALGAAATKLQTDAAAVKKHVVQKGESLSLIAKQYTGDVKKWKELYEHNKETVGNNPDLIQPGMVLIIPWQGV